MLPAPHLSSGRPMSRGAVLPENAVRPALDLVARENGASRDRLVCGREADFLVDVLHIVLGIDRRALYDYVQLARFLVGHHECFVLHHHFRREFDAQRLWEICWTLSPRSLDLAILVVKELKEILVAEEDPFPLFHIQFLRSLLN